MNFFHLILTFFHCIYVFTTAAKTCATKSDELTLELVQVLSRHGARTPDKTQVEICNFTLAEFYEPLGFGELTTVGKQQEYEFGRFLRRRYDNYLNASYKSDELYAFTSDKGRLQMSLQLVLAGLYPPKGLDVWDPTIKWTPVPYVTVPKKLNVLIESHKNSKFKKLRDEVEKSDHFMKKLDKFSDFIKFVEKRTLISEDTVLQDVESTFDVLQSNEYMGITPPDWYTLDVKQQFEDLKLTLRDPYTATSKLRRLGPGPLIKTLVDNMNLKKKYQNPRKIYLYSGHGTNVEMFHRVHNIKQFRYPPFGSAMILEKLRDSNDRIYVRLLEWDGLGHVETLKLGDHEEFCPIEDYLEIVKDVIPSEEEINGLLGDLTLKRIKKILYKDHEVETIDEDE